MPLDTLQGKSLNARRVHEIKEQQLARSSWGTIRKLPSKRYQASYIGPDKERHKACQNQQDKHLATACRKMAYSWI